MQYRRFGKTGWEISEVGFGAWGIGGALWADSDDKESKEALKKSADVGVTFIDTALAYGKGHSESLIAEFLKTRKERIYVSTKIPPMNSLWPAKKGIPVKDVFPGEYIINCTNISLQNLQTDSIDLQQFHVWNDEWLNDNEWWEAILKLKEQKKIKAFGVSINDHSPESALKLVESGKVDSVQVIYNIFDQSPEEELFPLCIKKNVGVIVRVPFDEGGLTGKITEETVFAPGDFRNNYFRGDRKKQIIERVEKLRELLINESSTIPELALRFCLSQSAVSTVIAGVRKASHIEENAKTSDGRILSNELLLKLKGHKWERNFYR
jgi:aryl-alcohol dehydrogenase-like predicted oxidoreductase